ncbi:hypothetical protein G9A89_020201 [Geosiphon pyriformis]|nr:hypothetical protein G9A89_020201 [Geosiphon pyriformis]
MSLQEAQPLVRPERACRRRAIAVITSRVIGLQKPSSLKKKKIKSYSEENKKTEKAAIFTDSDSDLSVDLVITSGIQPKKYLKCGLYSTDRKVAPNQLVERVLKEVQNFRFPMPIQFGEILMTTDDEFQIPWNIAVRHNMGKLERKRELRCPSPYIRLRSNVFVERTRRKDPTPVCQCPPPTPGGEGCGDGCMNRIMFYECSLKTCQCGDLCTNQRFQKKEGLKKLEVFWTGDRGFGLRSRVPIKKGQLVVEYRGEVISRETAMSRMETDAYKNSNNFYLLDYQGGEVLDASSKGTEARYINHRRAPNGEIFVGVFAKADIPVKMELTYDYKFSSYSEAEKQICLCGAEKCRGLIGTRSKSN